MVLLERYQNTVPSPLWSAASQEVTRLSQDRLSNDKLPDRRLILGFESFNNFFPPSDPPSDHSDSGDEQNLFTETTDSLDLGRRRLHTVERLPSAMKTVNAPEIGGGRQKSKKRMLLFDVSREDSEEEEEEEDVQRKSVGRKTAEEAQNWEQDRDPETATSETFTRIHNEPQALQPGHPPTAPSLQIFSDQKSRSSSPLKKPATYGKRNSPEKRKLITRALSSDEDSDSEEQAHSKKDDGKRRSDPVGRGAKEPKTPLLKKRKICVMSDVKKFQPRTPAARTSSSKKSASSKKSSSRRRGSLTPAIGQRLTLRSVYQLEMTPKATETPPPPRTSPSKSDAAANKSFIGLFDAQLVSPLAQKRQSSARSLPSSSSSRRPLRSILHLEQQLSSPIKEARVVMPAVERCEATPSHRPGVLSFRRVSTNEVIEFGSSKKRAAASTTARKHRRKNAASNSSRPAINLKPPSNFGDLSALLESPLATKSKKTKIQDDTLEIAKQSVARDAVADQLSDQAAAQATTSSSSKVAEKAPGDNQATPDQANSATLQLPTNNAAPHVDSTCPVGKMQPATTQDSAPISSGSQDGWSCSIPAVIDVGSRNLSASFKAIFSREEIVSSLLYKPPQNIVADKREVEELANDQRPSPSKRPLRRPKKAALTESRSTTQDLQTASINGELNRKLQASEASQRLQAQKARDALPQTPAPRLRRAKTSFENACTEPRKPTVKIGHSETSSAKPSTLLRAVSAHNPALRVAQQSSPISMRNGGLTRTLSTVFSPHKPAAAIIMSSPIIAGPRVQNSLQRSKTALPFKPPTMIQRQATAGPVTEAPLANEPSEHIELPAAESTETRKVFSPTAFATLGRARTIGLFRHRHRSTVSHSVAVTAIAGDGGQAAAQACSKWLL